MTQGKIGIVTDSTACLPKELVEWYHILVLPVELVFGEMVYRDGVDEIPKGFYKLLEEASGSPKTAPPSPATYLEAYKKKANDGARGILCVTISSGLSAMYDSARAAAELAREAIPEIKIEVLDSRNLAMSQGFIVLEAARAASQGRSLEEVTKVAESLIERQNLIFMVDTLNFIAKSGRMPRIAAQVSSLLKVKLILTMSNGKLGFLTATRTKPRAVENLLRIMRDRVGGKGPLYVAVIHTSAPDEAERLKEQVSSQFDCAELYVTEFTPIMGAFTGPGVLGLAFYSGAK